MNKLIIIAHPKNSSFSQKIKEELKEKFTERDYNVKIRDLYQLNFNPILTENELKNNKAGNTYVDIQKEQEYIAWADELIFIYPLWWNAFPAILKGYIDRVFTNGFAFMINGNGPEGLLKRKKVRLLTTAGMTEKSLKNSNVYEGLRITQEQGVFGFCGMKVVDHVFIPEITSLSTEEKQTVLDKLVNEIVEKKVVNSR